jgi:hypothetical protein
MKRLWAALLLVLAALTLPRAALAQRVDLTPRVSSQIVEVGGTVVYSLQAMAVDADAPVDPQPGAIQGFSLRSTASGPSQMITISNGVQTVSSGLVTSWTLRAERIGTFTLGPASVKVGATRRTAATVKVTVVPRGQAPKRADPFDAFRGLFDFDDDHPAPAPAAVPPDPKLALDAARARVAFLHATIDKKRVVVGEQVTLTIYLYEDPYERQMQPQDVHEPTATDFLKRPLLEDESRALNLGTAMVGDRQWSVKLVRKTALFPLKAGRLTIEPMSMSLPQARVGLRESERLTVDVAEPPLEGRPPGYALGDVGDMSLSATVTPRSIEQNGAVGVTVELRGTGNLPAQLTMPVAPGIEWLDAQSREKLGAQASDRFGGTRIFSYVARLHKDGAIDLGNVTLPFFDPDKRAYGVARASLGIVDVKKGTAREARPSDEDAILQGLPRERRVLEGARPETFLADRPAYWALLFGSPALCAIAIAGERLVRRIRERHAATSSSPERRARDRRAEAESACEGDDGARAMGAIARAVEAAVLAETGVNVRGGASDTITKELEDAGVADPAAVVGILRECEDARFSPDRVRVEDARAAWERAKKTLAGLRGAGR